MTGGIAEYLHNLWNDVGRFHLVTVMTPIQSLGSIWDHSYRLEVLLSVPERRLGDRFGDKLLPLRKLNTAKYFFELSRDAKRTLKRVQETCGSNAEVFVGVWDPVSHFWCREMRRAGIPYSLYVYGLEVVMRRYGLPQWRREDFRSAKEILAISKGTAELVRARFGTDIPVSVVNPGVTLFPHEGDFEERTSRLRKELDLPGSNILLTVARLVPRKGVDLVIRSVAGLASEFPDLTYIVAGNGPARDHLQSLTRQLGMEGRVRFLGEVDEVTKWSLYKLCDVFVLPNRLVGGANWEGFGVVFLEAAVSGKPSIGGKNGGVPDAIDDGFTGLLVDPEDDEDLSLSLRRLLRDHELRLRMGEAAKERATSRFAWDVIGAAFRAQRGWA